jgi:DNA-binding CsgD family transcriptional regulator
MRDGSFDDALRAWRAGDAYDVLALCEGLRGEQADALRAGLLRARALMRLRRAREAIALLESLSLEGAADDDVAASAMLLGTAYARSGDVERGLAMLLDAALRFASADVEIRSEIALGIALAHYQRRDFGAALAALDDVDPASDIVYARALECRGWIAKADSDFPAAVAQFEASLAQLDRCRQFDRFLEANLVATLTYVAVELLDLARWETLLERAARVQWGARGIEYYRFWMELNRSMADEIAGRPREALQAARNAAGLATSSAFRMFAQCRRAAVLHAYGELLGFEDLAASIRTEFESVDLRVLHEFEEISLPGVVAETLAMIGDGAGAAAALERLDTMSPAQLALLYDEPLKRAYFAFVEGYVADANDDTVRAQQRYRDALRGFSEIGLNRRMLMASLRLVRLTGEPALLDFVQEHARTLPESSWVRAQSVRLAVWRTDSLLARLTQAEREVVALLYDGKSTAQIAELRQRSPQTIRNTISALLRTFGVETRQALIKECVLRGAFPAAPR